MLNEKEFFSTASLARYLDVSKKFIEKHRAVGRIPGAIRKGAKWFFKKSAIEERLLSGQLLLTINGVETEEKYSLERHKENCRKVTARLIYEGVIEREPCIVCGETRVHAHHNDYSNPFDITWYCAKHHYEYHRQLREHKKAA